MYGSTATIPTRLTQRYGSRHPFVAAGMAFAGAEPALALAVNRAGGIGSIGVGLTSPDRLREIIRELRRDVGEAPFTINFVTCLGNDAGVEVCAREQVPIVSFHWGHPPAHQLEALLGAGCTVWEQVGSVAAAETAVADGVSAIVAQGWEAGGHNYGGMGTFALVPAVVDAVADRALVLASGGIADARGVAAALTLGADGVWVGTRLVASEEANVHVEHHRRLVAASGQDTVRSAVFGPEMPFFNPIRVLRNRVVEQWSDRIDELPTTRGDLEVIGRTRVGGAPYPMHRFDPLLPTPDTTGDWEEMAWAAGQGVGLIHSIEPAGVIVAEMMAGAADILSGLGRSANR